MVAIEVGTFVYVRYAAAGEPWHEHFVVGRVGSPSHHPDDYIIYTADGDMYALTLSGVDIAEVRPGGPRPVLPAGLGARSGQPVYRFSRLLGPVERARLCDEGEDLAVQERLELGMEDLPPLRAPALPLADADAAINTASTLVELLVDEAFIVVLAVQGCAVGDVIQVYRADARNETYALVSFEFGTVVAKRMLPPERAALLLVPQGLATPIADEAADDVRTLPVRYERSGERYRLFEDACSLMTEEAFEEEDWPMEGPRSCRWWLWATRRLGMTPIARHQRWVAESGVSIADRSIHEHEVISQVIETACTVDQLNVPSLLSFEHLVRRLQLIEEAHVLSPTSPSYEGSEHWLGTGRRRGGVLINPSLAKHVASRIRDETEVAKERRKACEEKRLVPNSKKKGDGRGKPSDTAAAEG